MLGFLGTFSVNFDIPNLWGLGKSVSRGFGTVVRSNTVSDCVCKTLYCKVKNTRLQTVWDRNDLYKNKRMNSYFNISKDARKTIEDKFRLTR